ncbi:hypothetical protein HMPREF0083_04464 [Aneurinibacillus aneurinilyticus ATCC 12856]|uniref:Uncharacterized protein n=1 Tax=Aneurinibacillus aneurinilyticus ATCC 12856 TaxID=649747 RepID=U1WYW0_ANEAE|nr:hypothetical protein HMPREF0083_04464 [Aneurinibacillus aneurinilyticus ATCC 12856]
MEYLSEVARLLQPLFYIGFILSTLTKPLSKPDAVFLFLPATFFVLQII